MREGAYDKHAIVQGNLLGKRALVGHLVLDCCGEGRRQSTLSDSDRAKRLQHKSPWKVASHQGSAAAITLTAEQNSERSRSRLPLVRNSSLRAI